MRFALKISALVALLLSAAWFYLRPGFDSLIAFAAAVVAFLSALLVKSSTPAASSQNQVVSEGALGVQAGRDANVVNARTGECRARE